MTVAATIEIGVGATPAQGLGKASGSAHGAGRASAAVQGFVPSNVSGTEGFRAGWQSLLASLGSSSSMDNVSEADANQETASSITASAQTSEKPSVSTLATGILSRQVRGTEKGSVATGAGTKLSSGDAQTEALVVQPAADTAKQSTTKTEGKNKAAEPETESVHSSRPARSTNTTKADAVSAEPLPGLVPAASASISQAVPVTVLVSPAAQSTGEKAQTAQTDISAGFSTQQPAAFTSDLSAPQLPGKSASRNIAAAVNAGVQQTAESSETSANPGKASLVPCTSGATGVTLDETVAYKDATLATNQASSPAPVFNPSRTPSLVHNQEQGSTQSIKQIVNVAAAPIHGDNSNPLSTPAAVTAQSSSLAAQSQALSNPTSASNKKASTPETVRSARVAGNIDSVQQTSHHIAAQPSGPVVDESAISRALTATGGGVNTSGEQTGASSVTASGSDSREAFATLDTTGSPGANTWIHAGAQQAEAGYQDPVLGWVGVRADLSGGEVHAQLVPGSADAAQTLGSHLTGLNTYLSEHHTPVESLTLTSPEGGWTGMGSGQGAGQGTQHGAEQQTGQGTSQNANGSSPSGSSPEAVIQSSAVSAELPAFFGNMDGSAQASSLGSFHVSVMA